MHHKYVKNIESERKDTAHYFTSLQTLRYIKCTFNIHLTVIVICEVVLISGCVGYEKELFSMPANFATNIYYIHA